jgi:hypothetical protein
MAGLLLRSVDTVEKLELQQTNTEYSILADLIRVAASGVNPVTEN